MLILNTPHIFTSKNKNKTTIKYQTKIFNNTQKDTVSFKGSLYLNNENRESLNSIISVQKDILETISSQTEDIQNKIKDEIGTFIENNSLVLNTEDKEYKIEKTQKFLTIQKLNKETKEKEEYIFDKNLYPIKKIKNNSEKELSSADYNSVNKELSPLLGNIDEELFKTRMYIRKSGINKVEANIKATNEYELSNTSTLSLKHIKELTSLIDEHLNSIPSTRATKEKTIFGDYVFSNSALTYPFRNVGEDNLQMLCAPVKTGTGDNLMRLTVRDTDNKVLRLYLIKDFNKVVSNTNPQYPNIIPPKLKFIQLDSATEEYKTQLQKDISAIENKMANFYTFLKRDRTIYNGIIELEDQKRINNISSTNEEIKEKLKTLDNKTASRIKTTFPKFEIINGRSGLNYQNIGTDNKKINIYQIEHKKHGSILKIIERDSNDKIEKALFIKDNKIIKNVICNDEIVMYPTKLKFYSEDELPELGYSSTIQKAEEAIKEHSQFIDEKIEEHKQAKLQKEAERAKNKEEKEKIIQENKLRKLIEKQEKQDQKEQNRLNKILEKEEKLKNKENNQTKISLNKLSKECHIMLSDALKNIDKGLEEFDAAISEIRKKAETYLNNKQNKEKSLD